MTITAWAMTSRTRTSTFRVRRVTRHHPPWVIDRRADRTVAARYGITRGLGWRHARPEWPRAGGSSWEDLQACRELRAALESAGSCRPSLAVARIARDKV
jgi:hypothetical protein